MKRICRKCGIEKELDEFAKNKRCKYGRGWKCKKCKNKAKKQHSQSPKGRASIKAYAKSPGGKVRIRAYRQSPEARARRSAHVQLPKVKARMAAQQKAHRQLPEVKACIKAHQKAYIQSPEVRARGKAYRFPLPDSYIKTVLRLRHKIEREHITPEMIELKRELILFDRLKKEVLNGITSR